jgi:DNA processing protein
MSAGPLPASARACASCVRRSWLLSRLSATLEYYCGDRARLFELLKLNDEELVRAIAGGRRSELTDALARFDVRDLPSSCGVDAVCRHDPGYPATLRDDGAPRMLNVAGGVQRLRVLTTAPTVAIVGSSRATDYGMEMARGLARGLAVSGVTVAGEISDGIAVASLAGALEAGGGTVTVMPGGLDVACPARRRSLYTRGGQAGCAVTELPAGCRPRRWTQAADVRILARLAELTVVVEANDSPRELAGALLARALGRTVAAVPGRVTSHASAGTHALLMAGASLVRGPTDVLELLCGVNAQSARAPAPPIDARAGLDPRLRATLDRVGAGSDTPEKLAGIGEDATETLLALSELELMGLLARGDGGRYVPRYATAEERLTVY